GELCPVHIISAAAGMPGNFRLSAAILWGVPGRSWLTESRAGIPCSITRSAREIRPLQWRPFLRAPLFRRRYGGRKRPTGRCALFLWLFWRHFPLETFFADWYNI